MRTSYRYRYAVWGFLLAVAYTALLFVLHYLLSSGGPAQLLRESPAAVITVLLNLPICLLSGWLLGSERDRRAEMNRILERERDHLEMAENLSRLLRRAEESRRMAGIAAREIKHPLTSLVGYSLTLSQYWEKLDEQQKRDFLHYIRVSATRLEGMINDLSRILELAHEPAHQETTTVNPSEALNEAAALVEDIYSPRGTRLNLRLLSDVPVMQVDPSRLFDLLYNLLDLAMRCCRERGMVSAWCSVRGENLVLHVRCPHPALDPETLGVIDVWPPRQPEGELPTLAMEYRLASRLAEDMAGNLRMDHSDKVGLSLYLTLPLSKAG
ncbi:sensor histidine kinase [Candidatus Solincola sp.]|nr:histidine kinase dimerization/phospho-acceptor domain-containing protein [Actinomycetota bacterium]MDI7251629.1 histidine kinase dimerization/phospho-acceptor domain-containing protein [Actinomycetota bacterium]